MNDLGFIFLSGAIVFFAICLVLFIYGAKTLGEDLSTDLEAMPVQENDVVDTSIIEALQNERSPRSTVVYDLSNDELFQVFTAVASSSLKEKLLADARFKRAFVLALQRMIIDLRYEIYSKGGCIEIPIRIEDERTSSKLLDNRSNELLLTANQAMFTADLTNKRDCLGLSA